MLNTKINRASSIYVAGHHSGVARDIIGKLKNLGYENIVTRDRKELDLTKQDQVDNFFKTEKIDYVFLCAARSTGVLDNAKNPADVFLENMQIQNNVLYNCSINEVKKTVFISSVSALPDFKDRVLTENDLAKGELGKNLEPYGLAKLCGIKLCQYYNMQKGDRIFVSISPSYIISMGKRDSLIMTLVDECHNAKINNLKQVVIWGHENHKYQFLWSEDVANAALLLMMEENIAKDHYIVSSSEIITKGELMNIICSITGYKGSVVYDGSKVTGESRVASNSEMIKLGWRPKTSIKTAIEKLYNNYY